MPPGRPPRGRRGRNDRAARGAYTLILGAVLVVGVIALFFAVSLALGPSGTSATGTPAPSPVATQLPNPAAQSSPPPFLLPSPSPSPTLPPPQQRTHTVEGGDTLNRIAQRYGVTVEAIMQANGFSDRNRILRIGERLIIPDTPPASPTDLDELVDGRAQIAVADAQRVGDVVDGATEVASGDGVEHPSLGNNRPQRRLNREVLEWGWHGGYLVSGHTPENGTAPPRGTASPASYSG
jgi:LysM repeat protein